jgi:hypothetical protein
MRTDMHDEEDRNTGPSAVGKSLTCEEFQAKLPHLMGGGIREHEHLKTCKRCAALLDELEYIAAIAGDLMQPVYEPDEAVWKKISHQIDEEGADSVKSKALSNGRH